MKGLRTRCVSVGAGLIAAAFLVVSGGCASDRLSADTAHCAVDAYKNLGQHWFGGNASFAQAGQLFVAHGVNPGYVDVWEGCSAGDRTVLPTHLSSATYLVASRRGRYLLASEYNGGSELFDLKSRTSIEEFKDCWGSGAFSPDERFVLLTCEDGIRAFDTTNRRAIRGIYRAGPGSVQSMAINRTFTQIAFGLGGGQIEVVNVRLDREVPALTRHILLGRDEDAWVSALKYSSSSGQLLSVLRNGVVRLWDVEAGRPVREWQTPLVWVGNVTIVGDNAKAMINGSTDLGSNLNYKSVLIDPLSGQQRIAAVRSNYRYATYVKKLDSMFVGSGWNRPVLESLSLGSISQAQPASIGEPPGQ